MAAALYYTLHSTLVAAALFLLAELIARRRGPIRDRLEAAAPFAAPLCSEAVLSGCGCHGRPPPLSGFTGKILILEALRPAPAWGWLWALLLATSLMVIVGFARAGTTLFWKSEAIGVDPRASLQRRASGLTTAAAGVLLAGTLVLSLFAGPVTRHLEATAAQIFTPAAMSRRCWVQAVSPPLPKRSAPHDGTASPGLSSPAP
jgi:multicomponent K+:H+ antiporter subunit D